MDIDQVKQNIRNMLNLANDPSAAKGEVENAMRFAARLMEKHQLSEEDLPKVDEKLVDLEKAEMGKQSSYCLGASTLTEWHSSAASFAAAFVGGVKWYYNDNITHRENGIIQLDTKGRPKTKALVTFYGIAEDVEIAKQVFDELIMTIIAMARLKFGVVYRGVGRSYCYGFMQGLWNKWYDDKDKQLKLAKQPANSTSTALMVIDSRKALVNRKEELAKKWYEDQYGEMGKGRRRRGITLDGNAYSEGKTDGSKYSAQGDRRKKLT